MSISTSFNSAGTIESATFRFSRNPSRPAPPENSGSDRAAQIEKQRRAMAQRLEQLNAALGDDKADRAPPVLSPEKHESKREHGTAALILTGILSACLGAGMMQIAAVSMNKAPIETNSPLPAVTMSPPTTSAEAPVTIVSLKPERSPEQEIGALLENWRNAWSQRDAASYLSAYSRNFVPADGSSREVWLASRQRKLSAATGIDVQVRNLATERIDDHNFKATFLQDYTSGRYQETARTKTLLVAREDGVWRITREWLEK